MSLDPADGLHTGGARRRLLRGKETSDERRGGGPARRSADPTHHPACVRQLGAGLLPAREHLQRPEPRLPRRDLRRSGPGALRPRGRELLQLQSTLPVAPGVQRQQPLPAAVRRRGPELLPRRQPGLRQRPHLLGFGLLRRRLRRQRSALLHQRRTVRHVPGLLLRHLPALRRHRPDLLPRATGRPVRPPLRVHSGRGLRQLRRQGATLL